MSLSYSPAPTRPLVAPSRNDALAALGMLLSVVLLSALSLYRQRPPAVVSASAPAAEFSAARAMRHLEVIAQRPRPVGSSEHAAARDYILDQLRAEGLTPQVQKATAVNADSADVLRAGSVENVVARLKGTGGGKAILLAAHYDSVPTGAGASDDGAAVAALLETLRALKAGAPLSNDVIFLFSDGEEVGLLGARAFVGEHPWARDVALVLNFEARGNGGPSLMFETSDGNGRLIREFAGAAPHPVSHSLAYEVYRLMPNDTDFTVFRRAGFAGLNFAYIGGPSHYHTALDSVSQLDERSLQHQGAYALALTRRFGDLSLDRVGEANAVYFDLFGATLVHYPNAVVFPLAALVVILFGALAAYGLNTGRLTWKGLGIGFAAALCALLAAATLAALVWMLVSRYLLPAGIRPAGETYHGGLYLLGFVSLAAAVASALYSWFFRKTSAENLLAGGLLWWALLMAATGFCLPGVSYLFTWPLVGGLGTMALMLTGEGWSRSVARLLLISVCAAPGVVLLTTVVYQVFVGLTLNFIGVIVVLLVLGFVLLVPQLQVITRAKEWALPAAAAAFGVGLIAVGSLVTGADAAHPKLDSLFYALDADSGRAVWASADDRPDEWMTQFMPAGTSRGTLAGTFAATSTRSFLKSDAPASALAAPAVELLGDETQDGVRILSLRVVSPRGASALSVYSDSEAEVLGASVNGKAFGVRAMSRGGNSWGLRYYAVPPEGIELRMMVRAGEPLRIRVVDQTYGLPGTFPARPDGIIPAPLPFNDSTFVNKSFIF